MTMANRTLFTAVILFLLLPWCLGLGSAPEKKEQDIHVSKEVKIEQERNGEAEPEADPEPETGPESVSETREDEKETADEKFMEDIAAEVPDAGDEATAAEKELGELMLMEQEALLGDEEKYYTRRGRVDPFEPFIRREESGNEQEEGQEIERREPQTPLERIALSQLRLTAILRVPGEKRAMAMVEDKDGKGYVVSKGTYIGENGGQITDILKDRIVIEEKYKDVFGKIAVREIEKKLQN